jgi:iron complex outermembrane recepter protein
MKRTILYFCLWTLAQNALAQNSPDSARRSSADSALRDTIRMAEATVRAQRPGLQQVTGGTVINVQNSLLAKGSSALEVLTRSPGVTLDYQNNSIALNGKNGVSVMLDGKLIRLSMTQLFALLQGISANDIDKIELLTTPPANYDAEGSGGIIDIVLKKNKRLGTSGSFSLTGGYGWREKATGSVNVAHNGKKIDFYGSYTFSHDRTYSRMFITSSQNMPMLGGPMNVLVWDTTSRTQNNQNASAGLDIRLNPKTTIGASLNWNATRATSATINHTLYDVLPDSLLLFNGTVNAANRWNNLIPSVYLDQALRAGGKIGVAFDYLYFNNTAPSYIQSSFHNQEGRQAGGNDVLAYPLEKSFANTSIKVSVAKLDYSKQLSAKMTGMAGVKGTYTTDSSLSGITALARGVWQPSAGTSDATRMTEGIGAAYANVNAQLGTSTTLTAGVRYEYSHTRMDNAAAGDTVDRRLGVFFPNILLSRKVGDRSEWQLSYSKRISRPSYTDLASFVGYSDPAAVYTGNPLLLPTITDNLKLGYTYHGNSFSLLFSRDKDPIVRYQLTVGPGGNLLYISPQNLEYQDNVSVQVTIPWKVSSWWTMSGDGVGGWRQFREDYTVLSVTKAYFSYSLNLTESLLLPRRFSAELSGWYNASAYNGTTKVAGIGAINAGFKKELNHNAGILQLSVTDLLSTIRYNAYYGALTEEAFSIKSHVHVNTESAVRPIIKLTWSRSFGSSSPKTQRLPGNEAQDEQERVRK